MKGALTEAGAQKRSEGKSPKGKRKRGKSVVVGANGETARGRRWRWEQPQLLEVAQDG